MAVFAQKLSLYAFYTRKNAQPVLSCQQAWTMLCCTPWTMLCCTPWTMLYCTPWTMLYCTPWTMLYCTPWTMLCCTPWTMLLTRLFSHDNNVVTALFNHQYCYNLLTRLSNNDNNNEQACSINIAFSCFNNREQPSLLHQCWTTSSKQQLTTLFVEQRCSATITVLLRHCSTNNAVTTGATFSCVVKTKAIIIFSGKIRIAHNLSTLRKKWTWCN